MIKFKPVLILLISALVINTSARSITIDSNDKPNIVFILADDLGWSDLGCFGSQYYQTPNIDKLSKEGMIFTSAYMMPTCAPSRASLMTGKYPPRTGIFSVDAFVRTPSKMQKVKGLESKKFLEPEDVTIAEVLKEAGYVNGHFGKWHLGNTPETYPQGQGFDVNVGGCEAGAPLSFFSPFKNINNIPGSEEEAYLPDIITDGACKFIEKHKDNHFFLYVPFYLVHAPFHAKKEWVEKYEGIAGADGQNVPAYGAMISYLDFCVGRILDQLAQNNLSGKTVVIFISDNGGQIMATSNSPLKGQKGNLYEGGIRVPFILKWPGVVKPGSQTDVPVTVVDFFPTLSEIAGVELSKNLSIDGESITPLIKGNSQLERDAIFWHLTSYNGNGNSNARLWQPPAGAIRKGDWKLIENFEDGTMELYNLKDDIGESQNLISNYPDKKNELLRELKQWQFETNAPIPLVRNPDYIEDSHDQTTKTNYRIHQETERRTLIK